LPFAGRPGRPGQPGTAAAAAGDNGSDGPATGGPSADADVLRRLGRQVPPGLLPKVTCPHCWHAFGPDQLLWVSQHADLVGDPVLGPEAQLRFRPSRFNPGCEALDARDMPCQQLACPRCHLLVPRALTEAEPFFVSIVGAPASGKSHFLAAMTWELRRRLPAEFGLGFTDADAAVEPHAERVRADAVPAGRPGPPGRDPQDRAARRAVRPGAARVARDQPAPAVPVQPPPGRPARR
jgi:hypothetical protein